MLKELHLSLNVAKNKALELGVYDIFMDKMKGYFDEENVIKCKNRILKFVVRYEGNLSKKVLSDTLCSEYKIVAAWDKNWIDDALKICNEKQR